MGSSHNFGVSFVMRAFDLYDLVHLATAQSTSSTAFQVSYLNTGRTFAVTSGIIAFCTAMVGLWLFTIASPYFFWFGAPTMFLMCYLMFHCES